MILSLLIICLLCFLGLQDHAAWSTGDGTGTDGQVIFPFSMSARDC